MQHHRSGATGAPSARALLAAALLLTVSCGDDGEPTVGPSTPSINIGLSRAAVTLTQGESESVSVTVFRQGGYTGSVTLAVSEMPDDLTATLDPPVVSGDAWSSTLRVEADVALAPGTYDLTITGSGPGIDSESAMLRVNVIRPPPTFLLDLMPSLLQVAQGQVATVHVSVARQGDYASPVLLAASGVPDGVATGFSTNPVPDGNPGSSLAFTVGAMATPGTYQVAITAAGAGVSPQSTSLTLVIVPGPAPPISVWFIFDDFVFTVVGDTWTWPGVSIARGAGYTGPVELSIEGLPPGVTASFDPSTLTGDVFMSSVSFTAAADAPTGVTNVTIRARGVGVPDATTTFQLGVAPPWR